MQLLVFLLLCGLAISLFFSEWGVSRFSMWSIYALLTWRFVVKYEPAGSLPKSVVITSALFVLSLMISAFISENQAAMVGLKTYRPLLLAGLLFTAPISNNQRKTVIILYFISAALEGLAGFAQYYQADTVRAQGFALHPIFYATKLAFVCGAALVILIIGDKDLSESRKGRYFLLITVLITFVAILFSQTRGVWVALFGATAITLFLYDRRKAIIYSAVLISALVVLFSFSGTLRDRAVSIMTSAYTENELGSTGNRLELWKGAVLIARESPFFGTGLSDFQPDIDRLIQNNELRKALVTGHAHNIFFHTVATQGLVGLAILLSLGWALLRWGIRVIRAGGTLGGSTIIFSTLLLFFGGLTEYNIGTNVTVAAYCFTLGLIGPYRFKNRSFPLKKQDQARYSSSARAEGGQRMRQLGSRQTIVGKPLVTIVTVVFNGAENIEKTIHSVLDQQYPNVEYLIIDGGSTDGTLDIVRKYDDRINYWVSEPDRGIYYAMNKGIELASGDWINFMNAGDLFYDIDAVSRCIAFCDVASDVIYGHHQVIYDAEYSKIQKAGDITNLWKGMIFCHQSAFTKMSTMGRYKLNVKNTIAADFEFFYTLFLNNGKFRKTDIVVSSVTADGLSGTHTLDTVIQQWHTVRKLSSSYKVNLYYVILIGIRIIKDSIKGALPDKLVNQIRVRLKAR